MIIRIPIFYKLRLLKNISCLNNHPYATKLNGAKGDEQSVTFSLALICFCILRAGLGFALAREFLKAGDNVVICSRSGILLLLFVVVTSNIDYVAIRHANGGGSYL